MSKIILPGLIDPHVHLRDPGETEKEDFYTGTSAALSGGYTTILDMPNNKASITTLEKLNEKIVIAKQKIVCDVGFYFGSMGDNIEEFIKVKDKVLGLKLYLNKTTGNFLIDKKTLEKIFFAWAKIVALRTPLLHSAGVQRDMPILVHAEDNMLDIVIKLVKKIGNKVHVCHISTAEDLKQIKNAKQQSLKITCGVTPHHLFLTENDANRLGSFGKMKPRLRSKKDVEFLWKNIDLIDVIESDHAPHTIEEKRGGDTPFGVPGLETTLPLLLTAFSQNRLTIDDIIRLCFKNPSRIFNVGRNCDAKVEVDLHKSYTIDNKNLFTKCGWSPFNGCKVKGRVQRVWIRETKVFENGQVLVKPGFGKIVFY